MNTNVGDEGGYAPSLASNEEAVSIVTQAIEKAGFEPGRDLVIALDPASTEFYEDGKYELKGEGRALSPGELVEYWSGSGEIYPIASRSRMACRKTTGSIGRR